MNRAKHSLKSLILALLCAVVVAACFIGCSKPAEEPAATTANVVFDITAEGWSDTSSPLILRFTGTTTSGEDVDFSHAIAFQNKDESLELDCGNYTIVAVSPVNIDGSLYTVPEAYELDLVASDDASPVTVKLTLIRAEDVKAEDIEQVLSQTADVIAYGDETLAGDAGNAILEQVSANIMASPAAANSEAIAETVQNQIADAYGSVAANTQAATNSGGSTPASSGTSSTPASSGNNSSSSNNSSGSGDGYANPDAMLGNTWNQTHGGDSSNDGKTWVPEQGHWETQYEDVTYPAVTREDPIYEWVETSPGVKEQKQTGTKTVIVEPERTVREAVGRLWVVDVLGHWE